MKDLLSIIIPAYNTAKYIKKTLSVILNQSYKNCEIIIVDDNSTDNLKDIIAEYCVKHKNIKYFKNSTNLGVGVTRNIGLKHAKGEFVTFLDSDDWPDLYVYETAIDVLKHNNKCDIVIWGIKNEFDNSASSYIRTKINKYNEIDKNIALSLLCNSISLDVKISSYLGSKLFRKSLIDKNGITFGDYYFEDIEFSYKVINFSKKIILLPELFTHYYQRENSIVHSFKEKHINDTIAVLKNLNKFILANNPNNTQIFYSLIEKCSKNIFAYIYNNVEDSYKQKEFILKYFKQLLDICPIENLIEYLDSGRLKSILLNN